MPFERPPQVNEPNDKLPASTTAIIDGTKKLDFDLSALANNTTWTFPAPGIADVAKVLFGDGSWQSIPGGGDMLGVNNLSDVASAGTARTNLGLGSLAVLSTVGTAQIDNSAVTDAKISAVSGSKVSGNITGNAANVTGTVAILNGGTGATTQSAARTNLGLGSLAVLSTVGTSQIDNSAVTDAKINTMAASKITGTIGTAQIANSAVTDAKIDTMTASKLTGSIAPARVGVTVDKTLPYNNAGTLAGSNIILDGTGGRSLWIAQDDAASFLRIGSNLNTYVHLRNDGNNIIRTVGGGNALFINDNTDAITNIATGTGNTTLGNTTGTTNIFGSTLTIGGTTAILGATNNRINVGSDATGDLLYRNSSGNLTRLGIGSNGQVLTVASGLPSWAAPSASGGVVTKTKPADQSVVNSITPINDDTIFFSIDASGSWYVKLDLLLDIPASTNFRWRFSLPSGATGVGSHKVGSSGTETITSDISTDNIITVSAATGSNLAHVEIFARVIAGGTAGTVTLQWAMGTANAGSLTVRGGRSRLFANKNS